MVTILLHSSKTMRSTASSVEEQGSGKPLLAKKADVLLKYLKTLSADQIKSSMSVSDEMAIKTRELIQAYSDDTVQYPAIDLFLGDIYSGLQSQSFSPEDRQYANNHLFILSGLYGILRPLDKIQPYRLEMGYKLPSNTHDASQPDITNLYKFWGDLIAKQIPADQPIINLSAKEYTKAVFPYFKTISKVEDTPVISPKFLTISPKTGQPSFVTVHAKIARGAYARWLIQERIEDLTLLKDFNQLGYSYYEALSTPQEPVFVAKEFKGLGLSVRLTK